MNDAAIEQEPMIPDELVITLRKPVTLGSLTYTELRLREPTAAEMIETDKLTGTEADVRAVALASGVPEPAVKLIGARDLIQASRYIGRFFA